MDVPFWKWHHTGRPIYIFHSAHIFPDQYKNVRLPWKWHVSGRLPHTGGQGSLCTYRLLHIYYPRRKHRRKGQPASEGARNIFRKYCWPRCHQSGGPVCLSDADTFPWQGGRVPWQSHGHGKYCHGTADHLPLRFYRELLQYRGSVIRHRIQKVVSNNKSFSVGVQSPTEINADSARMCSDSEKNMSAFARQSSMHL